MRGLIGQARPAGNGRDRGAVASLVAVLLGGGVVFGMGAVVVDVGRLYAEREQLQTGADAAAWTIAQACARQTTGCSDSSPAAEQYADANASDGAASVTAVCGTATGMVSCPAQPTNRTACLGSPPDTPYVEVRTRTEVADGSTLLPPAFARALSGDVSDGSAVGACARATWGAPSATAGIAVTFSRCEWSAFTDEGATLWSEPSIAIPPASAERVVMLHTGSGAPNVDCPAGPSGWDQPGGFGWLDDPEGICSTEVSAGGEYGGNTGNSASQACQDALLESVEERTVLPIPIYDAVVGQGTNATYLLAGFAGFVLTGYSLSGFSMPSWLTGGQACNGPDRCLYGYFVRGVLPTAGGEIGGPDLGVMIVNLAG